MLKKTVGSSSRDWASLIEGRSTPITEIGCWLWLGAVGGRYGQVRKDGRTQYAHRVSYEAHKGEIPRDMSVCHVCDEPLCVNPAHLFCGTHSENIQDMHNKGRHRQAKKPSCAWPWARLTQEQADAIRASVAGGESMRSASRRAGVSYYVVHKLVHGETYMPLPKTTESPAKTPPVLRPSNP